jgi:anti-sigma28 factor (negative regulator of flagellin synthesis)
MKSENRPKTVYQGKEYDAYHASQQQRKIETAMRACKRRVIGAEASGDKETETAYRARLRALSKEYKQFSEAAGLRKQPERANISYLSNEAKQGAAELSRQRNNAEATIRQAIQNGEYPLTINPEKQARHMAETAPAGRSVITIPQEELQKIINEKAGSGKIEFQQGSFAWKKKEIIDVGREIGYTVNKSGDIIKTECIKIHYSNTGTHAVPFYRR